MFLALLVGAAAAMFPSAARADESTEARAQRLFEEGRALMEAGRAPEACPKLEESERLDSGSGTMLNLAICYETTGRFVAARAAFQQALERSLRQNRVDKEQIARAHLSAVTPRIATIVIAGGAAPHARVDGVRLSGEEGGRILVDPGAHVVELVPGRPQTISLAEGEVRRFDVSLAGPTAALPVPGATERAVPSTRYSVSYNPLPIIGLVVAVVGATVASVGIARLSHDDDGTGRWMAIGGGTAALAGALGAILIPFTEARPRTNVMSSGAVLSF